ncbi:MAG: citrate/2-methylcitrate synthase [Microbacterium sp.]|uniref:citrate/2-methylcitrate synthase n=1 Tax=Microbacterium sp. TaxID=51671 RepID=UPI0039E70A99
MVTMDQLPRLTAEETAARLGIKLESLYAYVSRGVLTRERTAAGSTFDPLEVETFAARRSPRTVAVNGHAPGRPLMVLDTDIALIEDDELYFRGRRARDLARQGFEAVTAWIWGGRLGFEPFPASTPTTPIAAGETLLDRLSRSVAARAADDPLRHDLDPGVVATTGRRIIAAEAGGAGAAGGETIARRLWTALSTRPADPSGVAVLDAALVLLIDHDLAVSTVAARAAASARASVYGCVQAALGAMDSALHGNASVAAAILLRRVLDGEDPRAALASTVAATGRAVPGFGQPMYTAEDPRATELFALLADYGPAAPVLDAVVGIADEIGTRIGRHPNVDLALAALTLSAGMPDEGGPAIFAIGRTVGWIAHAMDEYTRTPLRFRPQGRYVGPM